MFALLTLPRGTTAPPSSPPGIVVRLPLPRPAPPRA